MTLIFHDVVYAVQKIRVPLRLSFPENVRFGKAFA
jgi:hypothetical protein